MKELRYLLKCLQWLPAISALGLHLAYPTSNLLWFDNAMPYKLFTRIWSFLLSILDTVLNGYTNVIRHNISTEKLRLNVIRGNLVTLLGIHKLNSVKPGSHLLTRSIILEVLKNFINSILPCSDCFRIHNEQDSWIRL